MRWIRTCLVVLPVVLLPIHAAQATVVFCNEFPHSVYIAIAYPQDADHWLSRGWLALRTGSCLPFDTALSLRTFYYRGESETYREKGRKVVMSWGDNGDRSFATWENDNFQYYEAERQTLKSTLKGFSRGMDIPDDNYDVTVTFRADASAVETGKRRQK